MSLNPFIARSPFDQETLAKALRAYNVSHGREVATWEETTEQARELWRERAGHVIEHYRKFNHARTTTEGDRP